MHNYYSPKRVKDHADFPPSGMLRWNKYACPGSIRSSKSASPLVQHPSAAEGTRGHLYLELILGGLHLGRSFLTADLPKIQRRTKEAVDMAVRIVDRLVKNGCQVLDVETKVHASQDVWGTVDILLYDQPNNMFMVLDYKNGTHPVPADDNLQLQCYAWGVWLKYHRYYPEMQRICWGIIQPNSSDRHYFTTDIKYLSQLFDFSLYMAECVAVAKRPNAPLKAGEWCHWCTAKFTCSAYERSEQDVLPTHPALSPQQSESINQLMKRYGERHNYQLFDRTSR